jgi:hypothetical protein
MGSPSVRDYGPTIQASRYTRSGTTQLNFEGDLSSLRCVNTTLSLWTVHADRSPAYGGRRHGMRSGLASAGCTGEFGVRLSPLHGR